jgi:hypothetical protein
MFRIFPQAPFSFSEIYLHFTLLTHMRIKVVSNTTHILEDINLLILQMFKRAIVVLRQREGSDVFRSLSQPKNVQRTFSRP